MKKKRTVKRISACYKIDWDLKDDEGEHSLENIGLPEYVGFKKYVPIDEISNKLSDKFGWTVNGVKRIKSEKCRSDKGKII